jgi:sterol desaturase/sphingolipid hydroxylase (fatty acid hydroxylase superfamily)
MQTAHGVRRTRCGRDGLTRMANLLDGMRMLALFTVGAVLLVEAIGYFWHRFAEHFGAMGNIVRYRHWVHHEVDYPVQALRPIGQADYRRAGAWTWFVLGGVVGALILALLPLDWAMPLALGSFLYAWGVISYLHDAFHVEGHWLERFAWFHRIRRLHDIHHWQPGNYGILFFWMDALCGTLREEFPAQRENIFPGFRPSP